MKITRTIFQVTIYHITNVALGIHWNILTCSNIYIYIYTVYASGHLIGLRYLWIIFLLFTFSCLGLSTFWFDIFSLILIGRGTLWLCQQFAIENGHRKFVDLPSYKMVDLSIVMFVYQRVNPIFLWFTHGFPSYKPPFSQTVSGLEVLHIRPNLWLVWLLDFTAWRKS